MPFWSAKTSTSSPVTKPPVIATVAPTRSVLSGSLTVSAGSTASGAWFSI
jgi:hypothetical protein